MKRIIKALVNAVITFVAIFTIACGGGSDISTEPNPPPPYVPEFVDVWKGVEETSTGFLLHEYAFNSLDAGMPVGDFDVSNSNVISRDINGSLVSDYAIQGSFEERLFNFDTLDSGGNLVSSFLGLFVTQELMEITRVTVPPADPFSVFQLRGDGSSFVPDLGDTWVNDLTTITFNINPGYFSGDDAAFFTGVYNDTVDVVNLQGHYLSAAIFMRVSMVSGDEDLVGTFVDDNTLLLEDGRIFARSPAP